MEQRFKAKIVYVLSIVCYIILAMGFFNFLLSAIGLIDDWGLIAGATYDYVKLLVVFSFILAGLYLLVFILELFWYYANGKAKKIMRIISTILVGLLIAVQIAFVIVGLIECKGNAFSDYRLELLAASLDTQFESSVISYWIFCVILFVCNIFRLKNDALYCEEKLEEQKSLQNNQENQEKIEKNIKKSQKPLFRAAFCVVLVISMGLFGGFVASCVIGEEYATDNLAYENIEVLTYSNIVVASINVKNFDTMDRKVSLKVYYQCGLLYDNAISNNRDIDRSFNFDITLFYYNTVGEEYREEDVTIVKVLYSTNNGDTFSELHEVQINHFGTRTIVLLLLGVVTLAGAIVLANFAFRKPKNKQIDEKI